MSDEELLLYEEWHHRLQIEQRLRVVEDGASVRVKDKSWHTKLFTKNEALGLFAELNTVDQADDNDVKDLELDYSNYEQERIEAEAIRQAKVDKKDASRAVGQETRDVQAKVEEEKERGQDLFNTFAEDGNLDDEPLVSLTKAEQFLVDNA